MAHNSSLVKRIIILLSFLLSISLFFEGVWKSANAYDAEDRYKVSQLHKRALRAFQVGDFNSCIRFCRDASNFPHGDKNIVQLEALALAEIGNRNQDAIAKFRAALDLDYNFFQCRNNFGIFLRKIGDVNEAKHMFVECIKIAPKYPDAYYHLGEILHDNGDLEGAIKLFQTAISLKPNYYEAQRDLGLALFEKVTSGKGGDISESVEKLQIAANLNRQNPMVHYQLGIVRCAQGHLDEAETEFCQALTRDSQLAAAHWELGNLRYFRGDPERAIGEIKEALSINPLYSQSRNYPSVDVLVLKSRLAQSYEANDSLVNAIETLKEVASMQKGNRETLRRVAELDKQLKSQRHKLLLYDPAEVRTLISNGLKQFDDEKLAQAKQSFTHALELNPNSFEANQYLGSLLETTGDLPGAVARYQTALTLKPKFDGAYYNLAYLFEKMNLKNEAWNMYQQFHRLAGKYPYDPQHIVVLKQEESRNQAQTEQLQRQGY